MLQFYSNKQVQDIIAQGLQDKPFDFENYFFMTQAVLFGIAKQILDLDSIVVTDRDIRSYKKYTNTNPDHESGTLPTSTEQGWEQTAFLKIHLLFLLYSYIQLDLEQDQVLYDFYATEIATTANAFMILRCCSAIDFNDEATSQQQIKQLTDAIFEYTHSENMAVGHELIFPCGVHSTHAIYLALRKINQNTYELRVDNAGAGSEGDLFGHGKEILSRPIGQEEQEEQEEQTENTIQMAVQWQCEFDDVQFKEIVSDYLLLIYKIYNTQPTPQQHSDSNYLVKQLGPLQHPNSLLRKIRTNDITQIEFSNDYIPYPRQKSHSCVSHGFFIGMGMRLLVANNGQMNRASAISYHNKILKDEYDFARKQVIIKAEYDLSLNLKTKFRCLYQYVPPETNALTNETQRFAKSLQVRAKNSIDFNSIRSQLNAYYSQVLVNLKLSAIKDISLPIDECPSPGIFEHNTNILMNWDNLCDWLTLQQKHRLLIVGGPGSGKTNLCRYLAYTMLKDNNSKPVYTFIFLIELAKLAQHHDGAPIEKVVNVLRETSFGVYNPEDSPKPDQIHSLLQYQKESILFICDGLDQARENFSTVPGLEQTIAYLLEMPNVVVATRPSGKRWIEDQRGEMGRDVGNYTELDIVGFNPQQGQRQTTAILQRRNPNITLVPDTTLNDLYKTPLICELLAQVLSTDTSNAQTRTALYKQLIASIFKPLLQKRYGNTRQISAQDVYDNREVKRYLQFLQATIIGELADLSHSTTTTFKLNLANKNKWLTNEGLEEAARLSFVSELIENFTLLEHEAGNANIETKIVFKHESFVDYLRANYFAECIREQKTIAYQGKNYPITSHQELIKLLIATESLEDTLVFMSGMLKEHQQKLAELFTQLINQGPVRSRKHLRQLILLLRCLQESELQISTIQTTTIRRNVMHMLISFAQSEGKYPDGMNDFIETLRSCPLVMKAFNIHREVDRLWVQDYQYAGLIRTRLFVRDDFKELKKIANNRYGNPNDKIAALHGLREFGFDKALHIILVALTQEKLIAQAALDTLSSFQLDTVSDETLDLLINNIAELDNEKVKQMAVELLLAKKIPIHKLKDILLSQLSSSYDMLGYNVKLHAYNCLEPYSQLRNATIDALKHNLKNSPGLFVRQFALKKLYELIGNGNKLRQWLIKTLTNFLYSPPLEHDNVLRDMFWKFSKDILLKLSSKDDIEALLLKILLQEKIATWSLSLTALQQFEQLTLDSKQTLKQHILKIIARVKESPSELVSRISNGCLQFKEITCSGSSLLEAVATGRNHDVASLKEDLVTRIRQTSKQSSTAALEHRIKEIQDGIPWADDSDLEMLADLCHSTIVTINSLGHIYMVGSKYADRQSIFLYTNANLGKALHFDLLPIVGMTTSHDILQQLLQSAVSLRKQIELGIGVLRKHSMLGDSDCIALLKEIYDTSPIDLDLKAYLRSLLEELNQLAPDIDALCSNLCASHSDKTRNKTYENLTDKGLAQHPKVIETLQANLNHDNPAVRLFAAQKLHESLAIEDLQLYRDKIATALQRNLCAPVGGLFYSEEEVHAQSYQLLTKFWDSPQLAQVLKDNLNDDDHTVRFFSAQKLDELARENYISLINEDSQDINNALVRNLKLAKQWPPVHQATYSLLEQRMTEDELIIVLRSVATEGEPYARKFAEWQLMSPDEQTDILLTRIKNEIEQSYKIQTKFDAVLRKHKKIHIVQACELIIQQTELADIDLILFAAKFLIEEQHCTESVFLALKKIVLLNEPYFKETRKNALHLLDEAKGEYPDEVLQVYIGILRSDLAKSLIKKKFMTSIYNSLIEIDSFKFAARWAKIPKSFKAILIKKLKHAAIDSTNVTTNLLATEKLILIKQADEVCIGRMLDYSNDKYLKTRESAASLIDTMLARGDVNKEQVIQSYIQVLFRIDNEVTRNAMVALQKFNAASRTEVLDSIQSQIQSSTGYELRFAIKMLSLTGVVSDELFKHIIEKYLAEECDRYITEAIANLNITSEQKTRLSEAVIEQLQESPDYNHINAFEKLSIVNDEVLIALSDLSEDISVEKPIQEAAIRAILRLCPENEGSFNLLAFIGRHLATEFQMTETLLDIFSEYLFGYDKDWRNWFFSQELTQDEQAPFTNLLNDTSRTVDNRKKALAALLLIANGNFTRHIFQFIKSYIIANELDIDSLIDYLTNVKRPNDALKQELLSILDEVQEVTIKLNVLKALGKLYQRPIDINLTTALKNLFGRYDGQEWHLRIIKTICKVGISWDEKFLEQAIDIDITDTIDAEYTVKWLADYCQGHEEAALITLLNGIEQKSEDYSEWIGHIIVNFRNILLTSNLEIFLNALISNSSDTELVKQCEKYLQRAKQPQTIDTESWAPTTSFSNRTIPTATESKWQKVRGARHEQGQEAVVVKDEIIKGAETIIQPKKPGHTN